MSKIVIVGAGMVGHRLADELVRVDPEADVVLLGDEPYAPYNRVLLSELVAGRADLAATELPALPSRVELRLDEPVVALDRARKTVVTPTDTIRYDRLVLATGAEARIIPVPGLKDGLPRGAHVVRRIDDARDITAASINTQHALVVGGGALGLEIACGLRLRDCEVTVITPVPLLNTAVDGISSDVLERTARDLGIEVRYTGLGPVTVEDGHVTAVELDGESVPFDMVVVCAGQVPNTALARDAGLTTDFGIVVDDQLRTDDPDIYALGDCAQTPLGTSGLIAPGWAQAKTLARHLLRGTPVEPTPIAGSAMRLKAAGMHVVAMGTRRSIADDEDRVVTFDDTRARRFIELVIRDSTLVGLTCVGAPEIAARLSTQFDRPGILPPDPLGLLADGQAEEIGNPTTMPLSTTVCRCNGVTKKDLVHAWDSGCTTVDDLATATLATTGCGGCKSLVCGIADWLQSVDPPAPAPASEKINA